MTYEDERGSSGWATAGIVIALGLILVVLVGGCAVVGGLFLVQGESRPVTPPPTVTHEEVPEQVHPSASAPPVNPPPVSAP